MKRIKPFSPGLDDMIYKDLKTRIFQICLLNNVVFLISEVSHRFLKGYTTLIPKASRPQRPGDFRPITITSVLSRTLFGLLAQRILALSLINLIQRAFIPSDWCTDTIFLLNFIVLDIEKHR